MALSTKCSTFAMNTSTGNQAITGLGFQPKIVFFWVQNLTADGNTVNGVQSVGVATSSSDRRVVTYSADNGVSAATQGAGHDNAHCISVINSSATVLANADFVSMDSDGFTINVATADASARKVTYLALGGTDLTNVKTGQFVEPVGTGSQVTTGVGFQPDVLLLFEARVSNTAPPSILVGSQPRFKIGFGISSSARAHSSYDNNFSLGVSDDFGYQRIASIFSVLNSGTGVVNDEADLTSLDADGFTLNWTTLTNNGRYVFYVALKGGQYKVSNFSQATSTGSQSTTGVGFAPKAVLFSSYNFAASTSVQTAQRISQGIGTGASNTSAITQVSGNNLATTKEQTDLDTANLIKMETEGVTVPTTNAAASLTSLDSDGWTLNWGTADATARDIIYLAMGSNAVVAGGASGIGRWIQGGIKGPENFF